MSTVREEGYDDDDDVMLLLGCWTASVETVPDWDYVGNEHIFIGLQKKNRLDI